METNEAHYGDSDDGYVVFKSECEDSGLECSDCLFDALPAGCYAAWLAQPYGQSLRVEVAQPEPDPNPL